MKEIEELKAEAVDILTDLAAIIKASGADDIQLAADLGGGCPDGRHSRKRCLYIQLACDVLHFIGNR